MHATKLLLALLIAAPLCSCSMTSSRQLVPRPSQDVEISGPDVARIYVARGSQVRGALRPVHVYEDERDIGVIGADEFLCWERKPGQRILRLIFDGRTIDSGQVETVVSSDGLAGQVTYYRIGLGVGQGEPDPVVGKDKPFVTTLSAEEGRALIAQRKPAPLE